jgi:hypothetical protein
MENLCNDKQAPSIQAPSTREIPNINIQLTQDPKGRD